MSKGLSTALGRKTGVGWRVVLPFMAAAIIASYALFSMYSSAGATHVDPVFVSGNPTCVSLGYDNEYRVNAPSDGTYTDPDSDLVVEIDLYDTEDGQEFDWDSGDFELDGVVSKGGSDANLYAYDPAVTSDEGLHSPLNPSGKWAGVSHISFCWNDPPPLEPLNVNKTVDATFDRTYEWTLEKSVTPDTWYLFDGDTATSDYTVDATRDSGTDGNYQVSGTITIQNPNDEAIEVTDIVDSVDGVNATIESSCDTPFDVDANSSVDCDYEVTSGLDGSETENTVNVTAADDLGDSATVGFEYELDEEINASLEVEDIVDGTVRDTHTFTETGTWEYSDTFDCVDADYNGDGVAQDTVNNTVRDKNDTENSDSASVTVNCYELQVSKTAEASFERDITWTIDKSVDEDSHTLNVGESATSTYTVAVTKTESDSNFLVEGTITIVNPNPERAAELTALVDQIEGTDVDDLECDGTETVPASDSIECGYSHEPSDAADGQNVATVTMQNYDFGSDGVGNDEGTTEYIAQAAVTFGDPNIIGFEEIDVTDTYDDAEGAPWNFDDSGLVQYDRTFTCTEEDLGGETTVTFDVDNTATITQTGASDDATVTITCNDIPPEQGQIIVIKDATPDDSPWTFHFDGVVEGEILSGQQLASDPLDPGTYTVSEDLDELIGDTSGQVAWDLVDIECVSEDGNSTSTIDLTAGSAEIDLGEGDTVTCTFFNEEQPPVVIPEVPAAILFPIIMLGLGGGAYLIHRRRNDAGQMA